MCTGASSWTSAVTGVFSESRVVLGNLGSLDHDRAKPVGVDCAGSDPHSFQDFLYLFPFDRAIGVEVADGAANPDDFLVFHEGLLCGSARLKPPSRAKSMDNPVGPSFSRVTWDSSRVDALVLDPMGLVGVRAEAPLAVPLVVLVVALEPLDVTVALEGQDVGGDAVEEPAVMRNHNAALPEKAQ